MRRGFPFAMRKIRTDNDPEFPLEFVLALQQAGIRDGYIRPRRPQQNREVEGSHRIDHDKFWGRRHFDTFLEADTVIQTRESASTISSAA